MGSESVSLNLGDSLLWAPFKSLYNVVNNAVVCKDANLLPDLEFALKKYKPDFICLLKNPACNNAHREAVKKASSTGIAIVGQTGLQVLSQQLVDEALIISDMFNLDEMVSLELLVAGQQQQPHFPGLTRGLVAMLLYYDGRRSLVSSLRTLVQASEGKSWTLGLTPELTSCITNYTNQLKDDGLILKIIDLVENMNVTKELELLHKNRALGAPRYRKQVQDLISEIRQSLAEIVFCWACQKTLTHEETMRLMAYLSKQIELNPDGSMDDASMTLSMAFLYVIDVGYLQTCEELDPGIKQLNLIAFPTIAAAIHKELNSTDARWQTVGLKSVFQFAWGVTLRTLSQAPFASAGIDLGENFEDDEKMIELAIDGAAFSSLNTLIVKSPFFHQEEFFLKRIHSLITDFIVLMPIKVKDMRNRGDESAKIIAAHVQEGLEAPGNLQLHFQHFLTLMANMYSKNPLDLDLALDYWCPMENYVEQSFSHRPSQRQVALFKFIRMAGDLLPAPLFIPYHEMLTSLASSPLCAHHCFNLLKMNGQNVVGGHYSIVSWDHFFSTLYNYYNNLREEVAVAPGTGVTYRQRILTRGINPQEVSGLSAVLQLIYEVVKLDPVARLTLAENPKYSPYIVIFGLITCSVPSNLKASLLRCLAAFSSTPVMAFNVWQGVENTQIIPTIQSTAIYHPSGILTELEDVETRKEVYPVTRAILKLINTLLEQLMRTTSVGGLNLPGLQAVLDFVCDKIFLKSTTRVFKDPKEKWQVIALCLKIFQKVLQNYRIGSSNYPTNQTYFNIAGSHPGFIVLTEMLQDSGLLRMVLHILDEGVRLLDTYTSFPGKRQMEKSVLLALSVLHISITKQDVFLQHLRDSDCDFLVTSLDNLLMRINPRSGEADHLFNIAKYVTYNTVIPKHSLLAIRILRLLCSSNQVAQHLISVFDVDASESDTLLHGFVECLEVDIASDLDSESLEDEESMTQVRSKTRAELLMLSLHCLKFSGPNLAHYLLGFNLRRPISQTEIQEPGVMGSVRTCLHAVLALLDAGTNSDSGPINVFKSPKTVDLAYQLIYTLCSNEDTSGPVLRYLRCTHDFFYRHLQFLPHKSTDGFDSRLMSVQSWLLKALAIELRVTSAHHQRSHVQRLLQLLLEDKPPVDNVLSEGTTEPVLGISSFASYSFMQPNTAPLKRKLMQILDSLDFGHSVKSIPELDYFKVNELQMVFKNCELTEPSGLRVIDIEELNYRLVAETTAQQNMPGFAQKTQILQQEIRLVLNYAKEVNESRLALFAKRQSFNAWRQVAEVILIACPLDVFGSEKKHQVVLEISQELIRRVVGEDFIPELLPAASGVILTLMTALRHGLKSSTSYKLPYLLPESVPLTSVPHFVSSDSSVAITHHSSLLVVLKAIVECLLQIGSGLQRVRANFYTAFLNLLSIVQKPYDVQTQSSSGIESAVLDKESEHRKLRMEFLDTIFGFGEMIMEVICRDACTGHDITKMLSLAVLDVVISLDTQQQWLSFLVSKGYLRHILDSLKQDDEQLQSLLSRSNRNSSSFRIFYVFESKMALLTRISSSPTGALALLRNGVFGKLADCEALDLRPDEYLCEEMKKENEKWILPNLMKCYRQILKAIMKLILSIIMSLGSDHREVTLQVLGYISHNMNFFLNVLRDRTILNSLEGLEELALVTAVLARASLDDPDKVAEDTILLENRGQFLLLRQHLLMMLPCLLANEGSIFRGQSLAQLNDAENVAKIRIAKLQIASHILDMCCNAVTRSGSDPSNYKILFNPSLNDAASTVSPYAMGVQDIMIHRAGRIPDLGLLVTLIMQCSAQLPSDIENHKSLLRGLHSLPSLTTDELLQYLPSKTKIEQTTVQKQRDLAQACLLDLLRCHVQEVAILSYMLESSSFILLRHLEYFLLTCTKSRPPFSPHEKESIRRLQDYRSSPSEIQRELGKPKDTPMTKQELENFKSEVSSIISESFFEKLQSAQQHLSKGRSSVSFLEAITHRLKRLVKLQMR